MRAEVWILGTLRKCHRLPGGDSGHFPKVEKFMTVEVSLENLLRGDFPKPVKYVDVIREVSPSQVCCLWCGDGGTHA